MLIIKSKPGPSDSKKLPDALEITKALRSRSAVFSDLVDRPIDIDGDHAGFSGRDFQRRRQLVFEQDSAPLAPWAPMRSVKSSWSRR